jgi:RHS repeat-associated protein
MEFEFQDPNKPALLRRLFDDNGEVVFEYDDDRLLCRIIDSVGRIITATHDEERRLSQLMLHRGPHHSAELLLRNDYDERGDLIGVTHSSGAGYSFRYDESHRMIRRTGRKGFSFRFDYDQEGRCIRASGDNQLYEVNLEYVIPGRVTRVTRGDGGVWTYLFDEAGALTQIQDPLDGVQQFVRDKSGRLQSKVDPAGNVTRLTYVAGAPTAEIDLFGHRIELPRDPTGTDPLGHRVAANPAEYEFGRFLDLDAVVLPSALEAMSVDLADWARNSIVRTDASTGGEALTAFPVRPLGVKWWPAPDRGRVFNDFGKLEAQQDSDGRVRRWTYDASGNISAFTDFDGGKWEYEYGAWHLLMSLTNPVGAKTSFTFTSQARMASCTDAGGSRTNYSYDLKDQLIEVRRHGQVRETYKRDAAGNLLEKRAGDGRVLVSLEIGPANLPTRRLLSSGGEHVFQYTKSGRYKRAATVKDIVEFDYDAFGNRRLDKRNGLGVEHRFERRFAVAESVIFDRFRVAYRRRDHGTMLITDPGGQSQSIRRLPHGLVERRFSNGTQEVAQYDHLGRCLVKTVRRHTGPVWTRRFEWSGEGALRRVRDSAIGEIRHEYDAAHRLRRRILPGAQVEEYDFDPADNLLRKPGLDSLSMGTGNRVASACGFAIEYDDRNHVAVMRTPAGIVRYTYDSRDQLVAVDTPHGKWTAEYDALGRRTRKTWAGRTTEFYWNTDQLLAEVHQDGHVRLYVYADPLAVTPLLFMDYDAIDAPPESGRRYNVLTEQTGTPCVIEADDGTRAWTADIEPFGRIRINAGATIEVNLRFPGHYFDAEIGLHYNRFRYYQPVWGRYLQSDPWGTAGGFNLYAYPTNPLLSVDVRGLGDENDPTGQPCHETPDDGEGVWAHTLANLPDDTDDPRPPIPWDKVDESRAAFVAARDAKDDLGGKKTVAAAGDGMYASGTSPVPGFDHVDSGDVRRTLDPGSHPQDSGMFPPAQQTPTASGGTLPQSLDRGDPGSYNSCHAEMQAAAAQPGSGVGVSKDMCPNCGGNAAPQIARSSGEPLVVTDPQGTHVFHPDGSSHGPDDHPGLGPIPRE